MCLSRPFPHDQVRIIHSRSTPEERLHVRRQGPFDQFSSLATPQTGSKVRLGVRLHHSSDLLKSFYYYRLKRRIEGGTRNDGRDEFFFEFHHKAFLYHKASVQMASLLQGPLFRIGEKDSSSSSWYSPFKSKEI